MIEKEIAEEMTLLLKEMVKAMKTKLESGEYSPSDVKNMIELLKNNNITCEVKKADIPDGILDDLPFESELRVIK